MTSLAPFWRYYGGKNRLARRYAPPHHEHIIEPFAGAAGYACQYADRMVTLYDKSPIIAGMWRFLIASQPEDILRIPLLEPEQSVANLPVCQEARWLVGFWSNTAGTYPGKIASAWAKSHSDTHNWVGWGEQARTRVARQVMFIKHWKIVEGDYADAPDVKATWFVDPPYNNKAGRRYPHQPDSFQELAVWCQSRRGQVIVCEQDGADWLPFEPFIEAKARRTPSKEVVYVQYN